MYRGSDLNALNNTASTLRMYADTSHGEGTELSDDWLNNIAGELEKLQTLLNSANQEVDQLRAQIARMQSDAQHSMNERRVT